MEEQARVAEKNGDSAGNPANRTFSADLVLHEESSGFELWLGSLEDAMSLAGLHDRGMNGFVNCAIEECVNECLCSRPARGRVRTHARGISVLDSGFKAENVADSRLSLAPDQVRALISFDAEWYSDTLGYNTAYLGLPGEDVNGYRMDDHFAEIMQFLATCRKEGRKVLIHCIMGINRSSAALVAFLCGGLGMGLRDAIDMTSKYRGHILSNESFLEQLIETFGAADSSASKAADLQNDAGVPGGDKSSMFCVGRSSGQGCDVL